MKLWLMRHGDALHLAPDGSRPLSEEGRAEALRAGAFLKRMKADPALILHSTLRRSAETAAHVAQELGALGRLSEREGLQPGDDPQNWLFELAAEEADVLLVGHLPFLSLLASLLLTRDEERLPIQWPTGSLLAMERRGGEEWRLLSFVTAKILRLDPGA